MGKFFPLWWHMISIFTCIVFYLLFEIFHTSNDQLELDVSIIGCIILFGLLQQFLVSQVLNIFPYWALIVIAGIFTGLIYGSFFIFSTTILVILGGIFSFSFVQSIGTTGTFLHSGMVLPIATGLAITLFTYRIYFFIVKPVLNSKHLSEKNKIIIIGIFINGLLFSYL